MAEAEYLMADFDKDTASPERRSSSRAIDALDDAGAIPKGQIDPVYEAKARVLNRAVSKPPPKSTICPIPYFKRSHPPRSKT